MTPPTQTRRRRDLLQHDVAAMILDALQEGDADRDKLAHDIIVVVRERVLRELSTYARETIR